MGGGYYTCWKVVSDAEVDIGFLIGGKDQFIWNGHTP